VILTIPPANERHWQAQRDGRQSSVARAPPVARGDFGWLATASPAVLHWCVQRNSSERGTSIAAPWQRRMATGWEPSDSAHAARIPPASSAPNGDASSLQATAAASISARH